MKSFHNVVTFLTVASMATPAIARQNLSVQPVQVGEETVRYYKGTPTLDLEKERGAVQITPTAIDHGSLTFSVAIYNDGDSPINFGIENFRIENSVQNLSVLSKDELVRKAENRATWSKIGLALVGGLAAAGAASQRNTYRSTMYTPYGTYQYYGSYTNPYGQAQASAIVADTSLAIGTIQYQLDQTRAALGQQIIQLTTVDPGDSYAGRIVLQKLKNAKLPQHVRVVVQLNGEEYPFTFQVAKPGSPAPVFTSITPGRSRQAREQPTNTAIADNTNARRASTSSVSLAQLRASSVAVTLVPATTVSGFCIQAPSNYVGTGSKTRPAITGAMPRCKN